MSTDRRGRLDVSGGCLLTEEVGWRNLVGVYCQKRLVGVTWWMSSDRRGKLEVPGGYLLTVVVPGACLLTEMVSWRYLLDVY